MWMQIPDQSLKPWPSPGDQVEPDRCHKDRQGGRISSWQYFSQRELLCTPEQNLSRLWVFVCRQWFWGRRKWLSVTPTCTLKVISAAPALCHEVFQSFINVFSPTLTSVKSSTIYSNNSKSKDPSRPCHPWLTKLEYSNTSNFLKKNEKVCGWLVAKRTKQRDKKKFQHQ